ncbi:MAG: hypothetical protein IK085_02905 [Clostridia bacterium]|nr:hypothetical protein [Clostridia bacterium]MBR6004625.1 hypothetical protein [Clostridia bacterium]
MISYTIVLINIIYSMLTGEETQLLQVFGQGAAFFQENFAALINSIADYYTGF